MLLSIQVKLWKELIELEGESEAKILLHRAVECVPHCLEMWVALAKLENYSNARVVLNKGNYYLNQYCNNTINTCYF